MKRAIIFILLMVGGINLLAAPCFAVPDFGIYQITNNETNDGYDGTLSSYDGKVAWRTSSYEILFWDGNETGLVATNGTNPSLYGETIAWSGHDGNDREIFYWDGNSTRQITTNNSSDDNPSLYDGTIAWTGLSQSGGGSDIYYWDGTSTISMGDTNVDKPSLYDGTIAWSEFGNVKYWDGNETIQLTDNWPLSESAPSLYDGKIAWHGGGGQKAIKYWDGSETSFLTDNITAHQYPSVYNGQVAWSGYDGNDWEIFYWDGVSTVQVTDNDNDDLWVSFHDGKIAWAGFDGNDYEIMLAELYEGRVATDQSYLTDYILLGDTFTFDYWWEMGIEPTDGNFDILFFNGTEWETFGWELNFDGSSDGWQTASYWVPPWARGENVQMMFSLLDWGQVTDPTVYLRNICSNSAPVPEPSTIVLMGLGLVGLAGFGRKKFRK